MEKWKVLLLIEIIIVQLEFYCSHLSCTAFKSLIFLRTNKSQSFFAPSCWGSRMGRFEELHIKSNWNYLPNPLPSSYQHSHSGLQTFYTPLWNINILLWTQQNPLAYTLQDTRTKAPVVARLGHSVWHTVSIPPCYHHTYGATTRISIVQAFNVLPRLDAGDA